MAQDPLSLPARPSKGVIAGGWVRTITSYTLRGLRAKLPAGLQDRDDHFMQISLLESQFEALEELDNALVLDLDQPPHEIAEKIILALS